MKPRAWEVTGYGGNGKPLGAPVHLYAQTEAGAIRAGKSVLRMFGVKRVFELKAREWNPMTDLALRRHLKPMPGEQHAEARP